MQKRNKAFNKQAFSLFICIASAVALWLYVLYVENPDRTDWVKKIPVSVIGESSLNDNGFALFEHDDVTIDLKLKAKRSNFRHLSADSITAVADVSSIDKTGLNSVSVKISFPAESSGVTMVDSQNISVDFYIEKYISRSLSVIPNVSAPKGDYYIQNDFDSLTATVHGNESAVKSISHITTEPLDLSDAANDVTTSLALIAVDSDGREIPFVDFDNDEVTFDFVIYRKASIPVQVEIGRDCPDVTSAAVPESIAVCGPADVITKWLEDSKPLTTLPVNEYQYSESPTITVQIAQWPENSFPENDSDNTVSVVFTPVEDQINE